MILNKLILLILILALKQNCFLQTVNYNLLELKDSVMYLNNIIYSGTVVEYNIEGQLKSTYDVKNGLKNGVYEEFHINDNFKKGNFQDSNFISNLRKNIASNQKESNLLVFDSISLSTKLNDLINYKIGGEKKLTKMKEKDSEGKLNEDKKLIYDEYIKKTLELKMICDNLELKRNEIKDSKIKLEKELSKLIFIPIRKIIAKTKNGKWNGKWTEYFINNKIKMESEYLNNNLEGYCKTFHENGVIMSEGSFSNNLQEGIWKTYYKNGILESNSFYKNGKLNGLIIIFHENGNKSYEVESINNEYNGIFKKYDLDGKISSETEMKNNKQNGFSKVYFQNGQLQIESTIINNKTHGEVKVYYESGKLKIKGFIDSLSKAEGNFYKDLYVYSESGEIESHVYVNKDGTKVDKLKKQTSKFKSSASEVNKSYSCKCCKSIIRGLKNGVNQSGYEYNELILQMTANLLNNPYEYLRNQYKFCTMKCARTCY